MSYIPPPPSHDITVPFESSGQTGNNAGYLKLPDGTLIVYGRIDLENISITTPKGSGYSDLFDVDVKFPVSFISNQISSSFNVPNRLTVYVGSNIRTLEGIQQIRLNSFDTLENASATVNFIFIGRWKE